jgi:hypothetical protein
MRPTISVVLTPSVLGILLYLPAVLSTVQRSSNYQHTGLSMRSNAAYNTAAVLHHSTALRQCLQQCLHTEACVKHTYEQC